MAGEYNKCTECGQEENHSGIYRNFVTFGKHLFCSWSCISVFKRMYRQRMSQMRFSDGNFPSYTRKK